MSDEATVREGRARYNATILGERIHHGTIMVIRVQPDHPIPDPEPGQWLELGLGAWEPVRDGAEAGTPRRLPPDGIIRRAYSISSPILAPEEDRLLAPGEWEGFEFFLSLVVPPAERAQRVPNLTGRLFCLKPGDRLLISERPMGDYTLAPVGPDDNVLFLATGTGEAPHNFMIWELLRRGHRGRIASVVSARSTEDLAYDPIHRRLAARFPNYRYAAVATRDPGTPGHHLQDLYREGELERRAGFPIEPGSARVFLCGNPGMIGPPRLLSGRRQFPDGEGMVELLEEAGFNADSRAEPVDIHYERYW